MHKTFMSSMLPVIAGLSSVKRYSMVTMSRDESVLEHLGMVALTCKIICDRAGFTDEFTAEVLTKALTHDLEEVVWGDVARPTKHHSKLSKELFSRMSETALEKIDTMLGTEMRHAARFAKRDETGAIVALADMLAVVYKVWDEVIVRGNLTMIRQADKIREQLGGFHRRIDMYVWQNHTSTVPILRQIVDEAIDVATEAVKRNHAMNYHVEETFINED